MKKAFLIIVLFFGFVGTAFGSEFDEIEESASKIYTIKLFDKLFKVTKKVLNQFDLYQQELLFQEKAKTEKKKAKIEKISQYHWDISTIFSTIIFNKKVKKFKEAKKYYEEIFRLLINIASGEFSPYQIKKVSTLYMIVRIANLLGNKEVIQKCNTLLVEKIVGIKTFQTSIKTFAGHKDDIEGVKIVPGSNGQSFISWSKDGKIRLWDIKTDKEIINFIGHNGDIVDIIFVPETNGSLFLSLSDNNTIQEWYIKGNEKIDTFIGHTGSINGIAFILGGNEKVFSWSDDKTIRLWDIKTGKEIRKFTGHTESITGVTPILGGSENFLSFGYDGTIRLWNTETGKDIRQFIGHKGLIEGVEFVPGSNGKNFLSFGSDKIIRLWDIKKNKEIRKFTGHTNFIFGVEFVPGSNGKQFISFSYDGTIRLWNTEAGKEIRQFTGSKSDINSVEFVPGSNGKKFISWSKYGLIRLWNTETGEKIQEFSGHEDGTKGVMLVPRTNGQKLLYFAASDEIILLWDIKTGKEVGQFPGHEDSIIGVKFIQATNEQRFLSWSRDETIRLWDLDPYKNLSFEQINLLYRVFVEQRHTLQEPAKIELTGGIETKVKENKDYEIFVSLPKELQKKIKEKTTINVSTKKILKKLSEKELEFKRKVVMLLSNFEKMLNPKNFTLNEKQKKFLTRIYAGGDFDISIGGADWDVYQSLSNDFQLLIEKYEFLIKYKKGLSFEQYELFLRLFLNKSHLLRNKKSNDYKIFEKMPSEVQLIMNKKLKKRK
ncbi:hypothetical protein KAH94_03035, partial [bacterium]|nr:hypothetical protein [bacterium]